MQTRIEQIVVFLLAAGAVASACAQPGGGYRGNQGTESTYRRAGAAVESAAPDAGQPQQRVLPSPHRHEFAMPYTGGYDVQAESNITDVHSQARMTLEERRILRRQIGEAGHELYAPGH